MAFSSDPHKRWTEAHQAAALAEQKVYLASIQHAHGLGPGPAPEDLRDARLKRALATAAFREMIANYEKAAARCRAALRERQSQGGAAGASA